MEPITMYLTSKERYVFGKEKFEQSYSDFSGLYERNHKETGPYNQPYDPDLDRYFYLERTGSLAFFTIRTEELRIEVGYALFFLDEEILQRDVKSATQSSFFVEKEHRGRVSLEFMRYCDEQLRLMGINSIWRQATAKLDIGKIYERMGYRLVEKAYLKEF